MHGDLSDGMVARVCLQHTETPWDCGPDHFQVRPAVLYLKEENEPT